MSSDHPPAAMCGPLRLLRHHIDVEARADSRFFRDGVSGSAVPSSYSVAAPTYSLGSSSSSVSSTTVDTADGATPPASACCHMKSASSPAGPGSSPRPRPRPGDGCWREPGAADGSGLRWPGGRSEACRKACVPGRGEPGLRSDCRDAPRDLKPQIGHNIGFQAPISTQSAWALSR